MRTSVNTICICERERNAIRIITYSEMKLKYFRSASISYEKLL